MTASFTLTLDTRAPANPTLLINDGAPLTGETTVWVRLDTTDAQAGSDVTQMKIWGDVDLTADPAFTPVETSAQWISYTEQVAVMLSAGEARKYLYARLRDDVGNQTLPFSDFIDLNLSLATVEILTGVDRSRISKVSPYSTATFTWQTNQPILGYQVRVVPNPGSSYQSGVALPSTGGSMNVSGSSRIEAHIPIITTISGVDLENASPGDAVKVVKVFVQSLSGVWSP